LTASSSSIVRIAHLITWVHCPTFSSLEEILGALTDEDLLFLIRIRTSLTVTRLAWAEYGRRHHLIEFSVSCVRSDGDVQIIYEGAPAPVQEAPSYMSDTPKM
jgi:hypothetical protein